MIDAAKIVFALQYGYPYNPQCGLNINEDIIELITSGEFIGAEAKIEMLSDDRIELMALLPNGDTMDEVIDLLDEALSNIPEKWCGEFDKLRTKLETFNTMFENTIGTAQAIIRDHKV